MLQRIPKDNRKELAGFNIAAKEDRTAKDTLLIDEETIAKWTAPPFQRPLRVNDKVREAAEELKHNGGFIDGTITIGILDNGPDAGMYLYDGQHRMHAFKMSGLPCCLADVVFRHFDTMADMALAYIKLNAKLVTQMPDDNLHAYESGSEGLQLIRQRCPFVGYNNIRRNATSSILSMSATLKSWAGSGNETPVMGHGRAVDLVKGLTRNEADKLSVFLLTAHDAWGDEMSYSRLYLALNLTMVMWLWRRLVLDKERAGGRRYIVLDPQQFRKCLMSLSADKGYLDWLVGRTMSERDRGPCYTRMRSIFAQRLIEEGHEGTKPRFPQTAWST